jgi:hypothetical protein
MAQSIVDVRQQLAAGVEAPKLDLKGKHLKDMSLGLILIAFDHISKMGESIKQGYIKAGTMQVGQHIHAHARWSFAGCTLVLTACLDSQAPAWTLPTWTTKGMGTWSSRLIHFVTYTCSSFKSCCTDSHGPGPWTPTVHTLLFRQSR